MKVSWNYSQYMESHKFHVPNHQPGKNIMKVSGKDDIHYIKKNMFETTNQIVICQVWVVSCVLLLPNLSSKDG